MTSLQQQIQQLAIQLEQLASQVEEPIVKKSEIDLEKILLEAQQFPFEYHLAENQDDYVKSIYLQTLLTVMNYVESEMEERYRLVARIHYAFKLQEDFTKFIQKSKMITLHDMQQFYQVMKENDLTDVFLIDLLMLLGIKQEQETVNYVTELIASLDISEQHFLKACKVVSGLLKVDHHQLKTIFLQDNTFQSSCGHYLMVIDSYFAPRVYIEGDGETEVNLLDLHTDRLLLKNVCLVIPEAITLSDLKELTLDQCDIKSERLNLTIEKVESVSLSNLRFNQCEVIEFINIKNSNTVKVSNLGLNYKKIYTDYLFDIQDVNELTVQNTEFEYVDVYSNQNNIFGDGRQFFEKEAAFFRVNEVKKISESNNKITDCKIHSNFMGFYNEYYQLTNLIYQK